MNTQSIFSRPRWAVISMKPSRVRGGVLAGFLAASLAGGALVVPMGPVHALIFGRPELSVDVAGARRGVKTPVTVNVTVKSKAVDFRRVYVTLRCTEEVEIPGYQLPDKKDDKGQVVERGQTITVAKTETLFPNKEFTIAEGQKLEPNSHHAFKGEIEIPAHLPPSYKGRFSKVKWEIYSGLDVRGWDPEGRWEELNVE